jgi:hypothetical protein
MFGLESRVEAMVRLAVHTGHDKNSKARPHKV